MRQFILLSLGILMSFFAVGQGGSSEATTPQEKNANYFYDASSPGRLYTFKPKVKEVEGSPYLVEAAQTGKLIANDSVIVSNVIFRYNLHEDCVVLSKDGEETNLYSHKIRGFSFKEMETGKERVFVNGFKNYQDNYSPLSYFEVLYDGETKLLVKHDKMVIRVSSKINAPGINTHTPTSQYSYLKRIYVKKGDEFILIKFNRSSVLAAIGSLKLRKHLKETKNRCRTEEDVIKAIKFYEENKK